MSTQYWSSSTILRMPLRCPSMVARRFRICFLSLCMGRLEMLMIDYTRPRGEGVAELYTIRRARLRIGQFVLTCALVVVAFGAACTALPASSPAATPAPAAAQPTSVARTGSDREL